MQEGTGKGKGARIPCACHTLDLRSARITQVQQAGDLVESLASRVVRGPAQELAIEWAVTVVEAGVPSRDDQANARVDRLFGIGELAGVKMAFQVIDRDSGRSSARASDFAAVRPTTSAPTSPAGWRRRSFPGL